MMPYVTYRDIDAQGDLQYYILQKEFPNFTCYIAQRPIVNFVQPMPVTDYHLWIVFYGTIRCGIIPSYKNIGEEIKGVMQDMALWFYEERILKDVKKYRKWKIETSKI